MNKKPLLGISSFQLLAYLRRGLFYSFLSIYLHYYLGMTITESTLFATFAMVGSSLAQSLYWGNISDKLFNRKIMVVWGEVFAGAGHIVVWYLHRLAFDHSAIFSAWVITIGLAIIEIFWSASNVAWSALISDMSHEDERSSVMGKLNSIGGLGRILGVVSATLLLSTGGFRGGGFFFGHLFFITALIIICTAIIMHFLISDNDLLYRYDKETPINNNNNTEKEFIEYKLMQKRKFFIYFLVSLAFINFGRNSIVLISNFYLIEKFNISDNDLGLFEVGLSIAIIFGGAITPFLVKKIGDWKLFLGSAFIAIFCLIGFVNTSLFFVAFIIGSTLWIAHVTIESTSYGIVSSIIPANVRGKYFGYYNTVFFLSWGIGGTFLTGPIADYYISNGTNKALAYSYSFYAASLLVIIGLIIGIILYKKKENYLF